MTGLKWKNATDTPRCRSNYRVLWWRVKAETRTSLYDPYTFPERYYNIIEMENQIESSRSTWGSCVFFFLFFSIEPWCILVNYIAAPRRIFHSKEIQKFHLSARTVENLFRPNDLKTSRFDISRAHKGFRVRDRLHFVGPLFTLSLLLFFPFFFFENWNSYSTKIVPARPPFGLREFIAVNRTTYMLFTLTRRRRRRRRRTRDGITCKTVFDPRARIRFVLYVRRRECYVRVVFIYLCFSPQRRNEMRRPRTGRRKKLIACVFRRTSSRDVT